MNNENVMRFIDYFNKSSIERSKAIEMLKNENCLNQDEKRLIISYCYPRPLKDRELPARVLRSRKNRGPQARNGFLTPDPIETDLIIEAGKTIQYGRFIKHIMHAFSDPTHISPISGLDVIECPICGKKVREANIWDPTLDPSREHLAFGNPEETGIILCLDCIIQLGCARDIIDNLEPGFLDWTKRTFNNNLNK